MLSSRQDDGRGDIARQVVDRMIRGMAFWDALPGQTQTLLMGLLKRWMAKQLGDAPTIESWQRLLEMMNQPRQEQQRDSSGQVPAVLLGRRGGEGSPPPQVPRRAPMPPMGY